jgi:hypothetical protein
MDNLLLLVYKDLEENIVNVWRRSTIEYSFFLIKLFNLCNVNLVMIKNAGKIKRQRFKNGN